MSLTYTAGRKSHIRFDLIWLTGERQSVVGILSPAPGDDVTDDVTGWRQNASNGWHVRTLTFPHGFYYLPIIRRCIHPHHYTSLVQTTPVTIQSTNNIRAALMAELISFALFFLRLDVWHVEIVK